MDNKQMMDVKWWQSIKWPLVRWSKKSSNMVIK